MSTTSKKTAPKTPAKKASAEKPPAKKAAPKSPAGKTAATKRSRKPAEPVVEIVAEFQIETPVQPVTEPAAKPAAESKKKAPARKRASKPAEPVAETVIEPAPEVAPEPAPAPAKRAGSARRKKAAEPVAEAPAVEQAEALADTPVETPAETPVEAPKKPARKKPGKPKPAEVQPEVPAEPPRYSLAPREDDSSVFGDYELLDRETGAMMRLSLMGPLAWRCDCAAHRLQADCEHGEALLSLLPLERVAQLDAGWPAREAEVWLVEQDGQRWLQWVAGQGVPAAVSELARQGLNELLRLPAERAHAWLQAVLDAARAQGLPLRVEPAVWPQLAWARDAQGRVARLEPLLAEPAGLSGLLKEAIPAYQWEAALFAVCAGRAMLADDLGLGQREAALAALRLWQQRFGLERALLIAPAASHAAWRRDLERLLGEAPAGLVLAEGVPAQALNGRQRPELLIVDGVDQLDAEQLAVLRALSLPHLLLIAAREPLGDERLTAWVDWLDEARRGPLAALRALAPEAGKRAQREALESVLLSRRKRELQAHQLPAALVQQRWLQPGGAPQAGGPLPQLRALVGRWQQLNYLGAEEQRQLLQALSLLPAGSRHVLSAKVEALLALKQEWLEGQGAAAARLLVCAQSETLLDSLAQALKLRKLLVQRLRQGQSPEEQAASLQAWRAEPAAVLLASDAALAALASGDGLGESRLGLVHADLPWGTGLLQQRLALACGPEPRGVPVAQLLVEGPVDRALLAQQRSGTAFPDWLDQQMPTWLDEPQLAALMPPLQALLSAL
ncbi:MAG: hypothetical protein ACK4S6_07245 [Roseateles asaccharophilus]|uniref:hypothetical protein n=1 Tax=Roseateles asaccharophilus TaxID=582607 RepID=UPI00391A0A04